MSGSRKMTFDEYMKAVDRAVLGKTGLSFHDLPDVPIRDWYDSGVSAAAAAARTIKNAKDF